MKLEELYKLAVEKGISVDPRGDKEIKRILKLEADEFKKLKKEEKEYYDQDRLFNPFADTRILNGDVKTNIKKVMVGIDIGTDELLLADRLNQKGAKIDLVIGHHPSGKALANFYEVMYLQADVLHKFGVPINVAEGVLDPRVKQVEKRVIASNHTKAADAAKLLGIPFMCIHTPADNCVTHFLQEIFDKKKPLTVGEVIDELNKVEEYKISKHGNAGPRILVGNKEKRAGKIMVEMTGGTEGSEKIFEKLAIAGVGTVVAMHFSDEHLEQAEKHHINIVVAGHISSDNVGLNILFDYVTKKGKTDLEFVQSSGFRRIKRS